MKHILPVSISAVLVCAAQAYAAPAIEAPWTSLCLVSNGKRLLVTKTDGTTLDGYCASTTNDELALTRNAGEVRVARAAISRLRMVRPRKRRLWEFWKDQGPLIGGSFEILGSEAWAWGLMAVPATIGWGAIATPYYMAVDLLDLFAERQQELSLR
jgi:hypothetical protein